ncbi:MAG: hypothetical protein Q9164_000138 [Protoblastenia rupestris]
MPKGEVMTRNIVKDALGRGKQVYVPYLEDKPLVFKDGRTGGGRRKWLEMVSLHSKEDYRRCEMNKDKWNIPSVPPGSIGRRVKMLDWKNRILDGENSKTQHDDDPMLTLLQSRKEKAQQQPWLDTIIMPGMAFDRSCRRLGHGKGYYDTFLQRYRDTKLAGLDGMRRMPNLIGLALTEQVLLEGQEIPIFHHDWPLDTVIMGDGSVIQREQGYGEAVGKDADGNFVEDG